MTPNEWWNKYATERGKQMLHDHSLVTPVELAKARRISPQVIYNYIRSGRIGVEYNSSGKKVILTDELFRYLQKFLDKEQAKQDRLERELRGEV